MYNKIELKKVQERLLSLAVATRDILEKENIPYFITYGTLLGAVRHKGFIPWDDDFDFYLFDESYDDALKVLKQNLPNNMFLEYFDTEPLYFHAWAHVKDLRTKRDCKQFPQDSVYAHQGVSIDLYRIKRIKEDEEILYRTNEHIKYLDRRKKLHLITEEEYQARMAKLMPIITKETAKLQTNEYNSRDIYATHLTYNDRLYPEELFPLRRYEFQGERFYGPNNYDVFLKRCYGDYMKLPPEEERLPHNTNVVFID